MNDHLSEAETAALFRDGLVVASRYCEPGACCICERAGWTVAGAFHRCA